MTIENLISVLGIQCSSLLSLYDNNVVQSFINQTYEGKGYTEKQAILAIRLLKKYKLGMKSALGQDIDQFLDNPTYKLPFRTLITSTNISIYNHPSDGKVIKAVFPYNEEIVNKIRKRKNAYNNNFWDSEERCWYFSFQESEFLFVKEIFANKEVTFCDEFMDLLNQVNDVTKNFEEFIPILSKNENNGIFVKNAPKHFPPIQSKNDLEALFEARKKGICVWDAYFEEFLMSESVNSITKAFLKTDPSEQTLIDSQKCEISHISDIVLNMLPALFIIPGGSELKKLELTYNFLKSIGIDDDEISVMFRLPSDTGRNFNEFVKNNNLNSPLSHKTKITIVSGKIPKPIFKQNIKFHSIINLGHGNVHYTMKDFVSKHENMVYYSEKSDQGNLDFGIL